MDQAKDARAFFCHWAAVVKEKQKEEEEIKKSYLPRILH